MNTVKIHALVPTSEGIKAILEEVPKRLDHACEQMEGHDCPMCYPFNQLKQSAILVSNQGDAETILYDQDAHPISNGIGIYPVQGIDGVIEEIHYCVACNKLGHRHCAHPEECGNVVDEKTIRILTTEVFGIPRDSCEYHTECDCVTTCNRLRLLNMQSISSEDKKESEEICPIRLHHMALTIDEFNFIRTSTINNGSVISETLYRDDSTIDADFLHTKEKNISKSKDLAITLTLHLLRNGTQITFRDGYLSTNEIKRVSPPLYDKHFKIERR